jgi:hypothetical protein
MQIGFVTGSFPWPVSRRPGRTSAHLDICSSWGASGADAPSRDKR